jgi:hypothetical protein
MILRILGVSAALLLAGCSSVPSLHGLFAYDRDEEMQSPADPAMAVAAAPVPAPAEDWCKTSSTTTRDRAAADGFDAATQDRMAAQAYQQCVTLGRQN